MTTTTNETSTLQLKYGKGYAGKYGNKCWVASITGTSETKRLERDFLEADKAEQRALQSTPHDGHPDLEPALEGLYERSEAGDRTYFFVYRNAGDLTRCTISDEERVIAMAKLMDDGQTFEAARLATKATE